MFFKNPVAHTCAKIIVLSHSIIVLFLHHSIKMPHCNSWIRQSLSMLALWEFGTHAPQGSRNGSFQRTGGRGGWETWCCCSLQVVTHVMHVLAQHLVHRVDSRQEKLMVHVPSSPLDCAAVEDRIQQMWDFSKPKENSSNALGAYASNNTETWISDVLGMECFLHSLLLFQCAEHECILLWCDQKCVYLILGMHRTRLPRWGSWSAIESLGPQQGNTTVQWVFSFVRILQCVLYARGWGWLCCLRLRMPWSQHIFWDSWCKSMQYGVHHTVHRFISQSALHNTAWKQPPTSTEHLQYIPIQKRWSKMKGQTTCRKMLVSNTSFQ